MRKVQSVAVLWTLILAVPLTALALSFAAYLTENLGMILARVSEISLATTIASRGWASELGERWPEVTGMIVGQLVIMSILFFAWRAGQTEKQPNK